jgi:sialate O-acetylesterase
MKISSAQFKKYCFFFLTCSITLLHAEVKLPALVGSNMVLQRDTELKIWGWASKQEKITVKFNNQTKETTAGDDKKWSLTFSAMQAGGPYDMVIQGENEIVLNNIMIGDVWLCSGQSNMAMEMQECKPLYKDEYQEAKNLMNVRLIKIKASATSKPFDEFIASDWMMPDKDHLPEFSAVAYFFGKDIFNQVKIPIGLISNNWGGSPAEVWMSAESLLEFPEIATEYKLIEEANAEKIKKQKLREKMLASWVAEARGLDDGFQEKKARWYESHIGEKNWKKMNLPDDEWNNHGLAEFDGIIWFRKELILTAEEIKKINLLDLGTIDDMDVTWINGSVVGNHEKYDEKRLYNISPGMLIEGRNVISVRVIDVGGGGGIKGNLRLKGDNFEKSLQGAWDYKIGYDFKRMSKFVPPDYSYNSDWRPSAVYNGMIAPMKDYKIKGVIWYQGEANTEKAMQYKRLFPALIRDWRKTFKNENMPFYFVQLANFKAFSKLETATGLSTWAELREAQQQSLSSPNTGMASAIDIGETNDIHPKNKQEVGKRMAALALKNTYKFPNNYTDYPQFDKQIIEGNKVKIYLKNIDQGLKTKSGSNTIENFIVAGSDKKFYPAKANLDGNTIIIELPTMVTNVMSVRYAWSNSPENLNVISSNGLPLLPFRTDNWPNITK